MKLKKLLPLVLMALLLSSCGTPNVSYFNDLSNGQMEKVVNMKAICLQPDDKISIVINSKDPQLASLFNLQIYDRQVGSSGSSARYLSAYTVDSKGEIDFPVIGKIKAGGMLREELAEYIKSELIKRNLVKDPVVTIEFTNLCFSVMGEVNRPGRYNIDRDHMTILDAISTAGDLTIQGVRTNVVLIRTEADKRVSYRVNLQSAKELMESPAFYLQQNDVVYVEPNAYRSRQTKVNGNTVLSAPFWSSVASLLTSIAVLIVK